MNNNRNFKILFIAIISVAIFLYTSCSVRVVNESDVEDNIKLEDGTNYEFDISNGIFFQYKSLTMLKKFEYSPIEDSNVLIKSTGETGHLQFQIEGDDICQNILWDGEDINVLIPVKKENNYTFTIDANAHKGYFEIREENKWNNLFIISC